MKKLLVGLFVIFWGIANAQPAPSLTVEQIMSDSKWMGISPTNIQWNPDSKTVYFNWNPQGTQHDQVYQVSVPGTKPVKTADTLLQQGSSEVVFSKDRSKALFERGGNIVLRNTVTGNETLLAATVDNLKNPVFSSDETKVYFQKGDNLFSIGLTNGSLVQLTNFTHNKPIVQLTTPQDEWLKQDQLSIFDLIKKQEQDRLLDSIQRKLQQPKTPVEFALDDKSSISSISVSPNGQFIVFRVTKQPASQHSIIVPNYVTGSGYTEDIAGRTKVGTALPVSTSYVYNTLTDSIVPIETALISGLVYVPEYVKEYATSPGAKITTPRNAIISAPVWSADGVALVNVLSADTKDRWLMLLDPVNGHLTTLDHQHDEAWIGGPGINSYSGNANLGWINSNTIYYQSEATGYSHLYTMDVASGKKQQLTSGNYEVSGLKLSNDKKLFYFTGNIDHPGITHFYKLPVGGGQPVQLTTLKGGNEVTLSPDEKWLAVRYSYTTKPWELYLQENKTGAKPVQVTSSTTPQFKSYPWREPEMITFKNRYGSTVYAQVMQPIIPDPHRPAVVFVHSNGYLQNVHYMWSYHFREYMFNNLLVDMGYTVINIDYTASSGYGRETRTGIYRHMGGKDLSDLTDGVKLLVENYNVNPQNVGLYGGSYGGFLTLMAMFTEPNVFKSGAALRSVTDWAHYNPRYTGNILNEPVTDPKSYRQSSPIYFADGLKGNLLMTHGIVDVNVNFQDIVRLTQRLIELGKDNWELAVYPLEDHNFSDPASWTDQYKRILKLFETTLKK